MIILLFSHPDKNPDPESKKFFVKIANAYEVINILVTIYFSGFGFLFSCFASVMHQLAHHIMVSVI